MTGTSDDWTITAPGCDEIVIIFDGGKLETQVAGTITGLYHPVGTVTTCGELTTEKTFDDGIGETRMVGTFVTWLDSTIAAPG